MVQNGISLLDNDKEGIPGYGLATTNMLANASHQQYHMGPCPNDNFCPSLEKESVGKVQSGC